MRFARHRTRRLRRRRRQSGYVGYPELRSNMDLPLAGGETLTTRHAPLRAWPLRRCLRGVETIAPGAQFVDVQQRRAQAEEARRLELLLSTAATVAMTERVHRPSGPR